MLLCQVNLLFFKLKVKGCFGLKEAALTTRGYAFFASQEKKKKITVLKKGFSLILLVLVYVHVCVIISVYTEN